MDRRAFLSGISGLCLVTSGGCLGGGSDGGPNFTVTGNDVPTDRPLRHEVTMQQSNLQSPDAPLTITISVTNETEGTLAYSDQRTVMGLHLESHSFILLPEDERRYEYNDELGFWQSSGPISIDGDIQTAELAPGKTHTQPLVLVGKQTDELSETIPERFEFDMTFKSDQSNRYREQEAPNFEWGFTIHEIE